MSKVTLKEAMQLTGRSDSSLRRDKKAGVVSATRDERGRLIFDVAELQRAYGELKPLEHPNEQPNDQEMNSNGQVIENEMVVQLLENQVADLKTQLEKSEQRENALIAERSKLVDMVDQSQKMLKEERAERKALMPAIEEKLPAQKGGFWDYFKLRR